MSKQKSFFEIYANEYDILTNAKQRKIAHRKEIDAIVSKFQPTSVLDAGCATGLAAMLFAVSGCSTVGIDRSRPMIKLAKSNYGNKKNLKFQGASFEKLPKAMYQKFDLVVCLANSISGVGTLSNLYKSFQNFYKVLKPGGTIVLQMLNYISIKDGEILPIKATRSGDIVYQRYSERKGNRLYIYINRLDLSKKPLKYEMFRHEFDNFSPNEVAATLKKAKFSKIKKYNDLFIERPFSKTSKDLVLTATKV